MTKLPALSWREILRRLEAIGYRIVRQRGSHIRLHHPERRPLTVPRHQAIGRGLLRKILRDAEISVEEFSQLRKKR